MVLHESLILYSFIGGANIGGQILAPRLTLHIILGQVSFYYIVELVVSPSILLCQIYLASVH